MARIVDLNTHVNQDVLQGSAPTVELRPLFTAKGEEIPNYRSVARLDNNEVLSVVSDRYTLVQHNDLLRAADQAVDRLQLTAPRGIYYSNRGARLRALYKFPALAQSIDGSDSICPLVRFTNSYDATNRVSVEIGAFRFVCTNWAVGGGGVFAAGFASLHVGEIDTESIGDRLEQFLGKFSDIAETYRKWQQLPYQETNAVLLEKALEPVGQVHVDRVPKPGLTRFNLFDAYNSLTKYATHETRTANVAFRLLDVVNRTFQGFSTN
jgi:hypothetical protein